MCACEVQEDRSALAVLGIGASMNGRVAAPQRDCNTFNHLYRCMRE